MRFYSHTIRTLAILAAAGSLLTAAPTALAMGGEEGHQPTDDGSEYGGEEGHQPTDDGSEYGGEEGHHPVEGIGGEEGHRPVGLESGALWGVLQIHAMTAPSDESLDELFGQLGAAEEDRRPEHVGAANDNGAFDCADSGFTGACWGDQLAFCDGDGMVQVDDCAAAGQACGFSAADGWYDCVDTSAGPIDSKDAQLSDWTDMDLLADDTASGGCSGGGGSSLPLGMAAAMLLWVIVRRR